MARDRPIHAASSCIKLACAAVCVWPPECANYLGTTKVCLVMRCIQVPIAASSGNVLLEIC